MSGYDYDPEELADLVYDLIKDVRDPEKPQTLEELMVVYEDGITVTPLDREVCLITVQFTPTIPHCSLATLIGLCIRVKLERELPQKHKLDIKIAEGTHETEAEINKQINDKERVSAALENPNLQSLVEQCVAVQDY